MPRPVHQSPELVAVEAKLESVAVIAAHLLAIVRECDRTLKTLSARPAPPLSVPPTFVQPPSVPREASPRVLRISDVTKRVGLSRSTIWRMASEGGFPRPFHLTERTVGWMESDVAAWLATRMQPKGSGEE